MTNEDRSTDFRGKRVLVMGLGLHGGGAGTAAFLARHGARVTVTDLRSRKILAPSLRALKRFRDISYVLGKHRKKDFLHADVVVKNPGVPPHSPYLHFAKARGIRITSDIGIFFRLCPATIVGVTGTRGKSTTAALMYHFLRVRFRRVFLAGNIRKSVLDLLEGLKKGDLMVLELSSFQLADLAAEKKSPQVAVWTNVFRDHLNWHRAMPEYIGAKKNIFRFQKKGDVLFIPGSNRVLQTIVASAPAVVKKTALPASLRRIVNEKLGAHYEDSVGLAVWVARYFGVAFSAIKKAFARFRALEGREEYLGVFRGVHVVNDTTATMPEATIAALVRFRKKASKTGRLILIVGGNDKKLDFRQMIPAMRHFSDMTIFLPGTATEKIVRMFGGSRMITRSMKEAVDAAFARAKKGDWILLSPGAASFGLFLNEFDRGDQFIQHVHSYR